MNRAAKVVMVCTGNICRSPAMHYLAQREWGPAADVSSAGTHAETYLDSTREMRAAAAELGLTYPRHRPTQLDAGHIARADLVLVATDRHARWIEQHIGRHPHVFVLKEAVELAGRCAPPPGDDAAQRLAAAATTLDAERERRPAALAGLDDPWGHDHATHVRVMQEIVDSTAAITAWARL